MSQVWLEELETGERHREKKPEKRKCSERTEERKQMKKTKVCEPKKAGEDKENVEGRAAGKTKKVKQEQEPLKDLIGEIVSDSDDSLDSRPVKRAQVVISKGLEERKADMSQDVETFLSSEEILETQEMSLESKEEAKVVVR